MTIDPGTFETVVPLRFVTFTFPNPITSFHQNHLRSPFLRVAVLDSPATADPPRVAAMLVPPHRESDWTFSTEAGHFQLLLNSSPHPSRLILIGNVPISPDPGKYNRPVDALLDSAQWEKIEEKLTPLLLALSPKLSFQNGLPEVPFLNYEDDVIRSVVVERCIGSCVGEMLIEDVELELNGDLGQCERQFRRRLRFKRMPNLIQTQMRIRHEKGNSENVLGDLNWKVDVGVLVHPYLTPMVAGLSLIGSYVDERIRCGLKPRALCLGVGGGALLSFLNTQLGFEVVGMEADEIVLRIARQYFGSEVTESVRVCVGDGIEMIQNLAHEEHSVDFLVSKNVEDACCLHNFRTFDVIMVDLDSSDTQMGLSAPPLEFVRKSVILAARQVLCDRGILVINVIPPSRSLYETLIRLFQEVFPEIYEIDVGNGDNVVLIATASPIGIACLDRENSFLAKLKLAISGTYMDSIVKI